MFSKLVHLCLAAAAVSARPMYGSPMHPRADKYGSPMYPRADNGSVHIETAAPGYSGYNTVWQDAFTGNSGDLPNEGTWQIMTDVHVNNELQTYTRSNQNVQISGGGSLQIVPRRDSSGAWTSARLESNYVFTPADGKITVAEASIRFGSGMTAATGAGMWPAFWILGDAIRNGVTWPKGGEIDIMERVNGLFTGYGTIHCDVYPGGVCNEPSGLGLSVGIPDNGWHNWRMTIDRTPGSYADESLTWSLDGTSYHVVKGSQLGETVWNSLAASPLYFILNVAVGGDWPGSPNSATLDGFDNMMEVAYVAQYQSQ